MFKPEYVEIIKRREVKLDPAMEKKFIPDLGGLFCLNTARQIAMRFFSLDEALDLIHAGYQVALESGRTVPEDIERLEEFPNDMVEEGRIELTGEFVGELKWNGKSQKFRNRQELKTLLEPHTIADRTN